MDIIGWTFPQISEAIMNDAPGIDAAIKRRNAVFSLQVAKNLMADEHPAAGCKKKQCPHGDPELVTAQIAHAARLAQEAQEME